MKIEVTRDDGTVIDITEGVQIAYDGLTSSMDWASGFLDLEEMEEMAKLAGACGFSDFQKIADQVARERKKQEQRQELRDRELKARRDQEMRMEALGSPTQKKRFMAMLTSEGLAVVDVTEGKP